MAYKLLGFDVWYCDPTTYANLQYCGAFNLIIAGCSTPISTGYNSPAELYGLMSASLDSDAVSKLSGLGIIDDTNYERYGTEYLQYFVPEMTYQNVNNNTGANAKLKLIASNGQYAISNSTISNGRRWFGSSLQPQFYSLFLADGTRVGTQTYPLTAHGYTCCSFLLCKNYTGGDLPLLSSSNFYSYNVTAPYNGNVNLAYIDSRSISVNAIDQQAVTDWFNGVTPHITGYNVTYALTGCTGDPDNPSVIPPEYILTHMRFIPDTGYSFNSGSVWIDGQGFDPGTPVNFNFDPTTGELLVGIMTSDIVVHVTANTDPYSQIDGESDLPGGGTVPVPGLPGLSAVSSGVVGLFSPTPAQMALLSDYMWTDFGGTGTTEVDVLKEVVQALKRLISNPLDYIVGLNIIPSQGLSVGTAQEIRFGFTNSGVSMPRLTSQYFTVDCGSLSFDTVCGNTFLDYAPYSKFSIYLPYIGVKDVDANDFVGHTISVMYRGDVVTGGVTAYILKDGTTMYQYSGCCALNVPLSADSWGTTISGAVQIATSIVAGAVSGGSAGATMAMAKGASSVASNPSMLSPQVAHSGAVSGSAGFMGVQYPFVIREAVRFHSTDGFNTVSGYPDYTFRKLSTVFGYTEVLDVHLHDIPATSGEITEIETLLKGGVIF